MLALGDQDRQSVVEWWMAVDEAAAQVRAKAV